MKLFLPKRVSSWADGGEGFMFTIWEFYFPPVTFPLNRLCSYNQRLDCTAQHRSCESLSQRSSIPGRWSGKCVPLHVSHQSDRQTGGVLDEQSLDPEPQECRRPSPSPCSRCCSSGCPGVWPRLSELLRPAVFSSQLLCGSDRVWRSFCLSAQSLSLVRANHHQIVSVFFISGTV